MAIRARSETRKSQLVLNRLPGLAQLADITDYMSITDIIYEQL